MVYENIEAKILLLFSYRAGKAKPRFTISRGLISQKLPTERFNNETHAKMYIHFEHQAIST